MAVALPWSSPVTTQRILAPWLASAASSGPGELRQGSRQQVNCDLASDSQPDLVFAHAADRIPTARPFNRWSVALQTDSAWCFSKGRAEPANTG